MLERYQGVINVLARRIVALPLGLDRPAEVTRLPLSPTTTPTMRRWLSRRCVSAIGNLAKAVLVTGQAYQDTEGPLLNEFVRTLPTCMPSLADGANGSG